MRNFNFPAFLSQRYRTPTLKLRCHPSAFSEIPQAPQVVFTCVRWIHILNFNFPLCSEPEIQIPAH